MPIKNTAVLYEINAHTFINRLSRKWGRPVTLSDVPDSELNRLADLGIGAVWLMGVWERSPHSIHIGKQDQSLQTAFSEVLPDMQDEDFIGSAYSVHDYKVDPKLGGDVGLAAIREKLEARGIDLMLDFVPNHTAPDHSWVASHPDYYIHGSSEDITADPKSFIDCSGTILANGRDPQYPAWSDVVQLNAFSPGYRQAAIDTLRLIAQVCDGVRCDMSMLLMNDIFAKNWGNRAGQPPETDFWVEVISAVRETNPNFKFMAETYWDTEEDLTKQGFDFCYDKTLYDLLRDAGGKEVEAHLEKTSKFQDHLARFIENHDEERAASAYIERHEAAAAITATLPGLWLFHDGQAEGYRTRIPVHLSRGPEEEKDEKLYAFYAKLLTVLKVWQLGNGAWQLLKRDNPDVIASGWAIGDDLHIAIVNYSVKQAQVTVHFDRHEKRAPDALLTDYLSDAAFTLQVASDHESTLQLALEPWQILLLTHHAAA